MKDLQQLFKEFEQHAGEIHRIVKEMCEDVKHTCAYEYNQEATMDKFPHSHDTFDNVWVEKCACGNTKTVMTDRGNV